MSTTNNKLIAQCQYFALHKRILQLHTMSVPHNVTIEQSLSLYIISLPHHIEIYSSI